MTDLDTTFAAVGFTTTNFFPPTNQANAKAIALQPDGKIVVAGHALQSFTVPFPGGVNSHVAVARYNTNGTLDTSFGTLGLATFLLQTTIPPFSPSINTTSLAIQPNGSIVVCGYLLFTQIFVVRFTLTGVLDTTFAFPNGFLFITPPMFLASYPLNTFTDCIAESVKIDTGSSPNKIIIGGSVRGVIPPAVVVISGFAMVKLDLNGTLDALFGINGLLVKNFSGLNETGKSLEIGSGKYFLAGKQGLTTPTLRFIVSKFDNAGNVDFSFGTGGVTVIPAFLPFTSQEATSMVIQTDGKIVLAGSSFSSTPPFAVSYALARLDNFGALDTSFGSAGKVITSLINLDLNGYSVVIQPNGKIVLAGHYFNTLNSIDSSFSLVRYNVNGSIDTTFGISANGFILDDLFPGTMQEFGFACTIQPDGRILVCGPKGDFSSPTSAVEFIVARYLSFLPPTPPNPPTPIPVSPICFPAGTIVKTDQGNIPIEDINPDVHTICSKIIVALTKSYTHEDTIVCFNRHSFGQDIPDKVTYSSNNHLIMYKDKLIPAKMFVGRSPLITFKSYTGELMYNILMEKHHVITVNNMKVETLNPNHIMATLHRDKHSPDEKKKLILQITETSINYENDAKSTKLKTMRHNYTQRNLNIVRQNSAFQTKKNYMCILPRKPIRNDVCPDIPLACPAILPTQSASILPTLTRTPIRFMTMRNYSRVFQPARNYSRVFQPTRNRFTRRF